MRSLDTMALAENQPEVGTFGEKYATRPTDLEQVNCTRPEVSSTRLRRADE